ncbi:MAG TPA: prolyl oligopeptidase family serine peptidase [Blastocatellia bacterium]|nr:prolyl oligopeptidase family serine peptidase [Blastocatellia bacterium]
MNSFTGLCHRKTALLVSALLIVSQITPAFAGQNAAGDKKFDLTIDNIMRGPALVGYEPGGLRWSADGQRLYFQWKQYTEAREKEMDTYAVNCDGTGLRKLSEEEAKSAPPAGGERSRDKKLAVFVENGDLFLHDTAAGTRRQLTATTDIESNPHFTRDGKRVTFMRGGNLFVMALDAGLLAQMTDIRPAGQGAPGPQIGSGSQFGGGQGGGRQQQAASAQRGTESQEVLKKDERELLDVVKRRAEKREADEAKRKREERLKPFNLVPRQSVANLQLSPDEKFVIASIVETADGAKNTAVPNYVTESAYTEEIPSRTKVGDAQPRLRLAALNLTSGEVKWVDHGQRLAPRTETRTEQQAAQAERREGEQNVRQATEAQAAERQGQAGQTTEGRRTGESARQANERDVQLQQPLWSEDGTKAILMARAADNKDRWVLALDPATGKTRVIVSEHDDAWIDGPGAFTLGWLADNQHIYFQSERDGYAHLYTVAYDGTDTRQLTAGKWEVTGVQLSEDKSKFYITTSEVHPGERHLYLMSVTGGERTRITTMAGNNQAFISPDEKTLALVYSYSNKPPEIYLQENRAGASAMKVTNSPAPEFWSYNWVDPPIVTFKARDGATLYARLYKPANFRRGGAAVIFVHGAGYLQNVHRWWSSYYREYLFHHLLMAQGFMVLDVDYRGSAGYGRDWRTGIYRHMGGQDLDDQVDAARWLASEHGVDARRIGVYGGSYGGFITLMAMFTQPDVFAAGAALRPVTDWAHYNHPYTANILNTPQADAEAYRRSSPIYFAAGLKGALLICHGMVDTNVHFQDTVRLVQRLIELRKENWELAVFPVEDHGFVEPTSWADEYKRILKLFTKNLQGDAPPSPARAGSAAHKQ